MIFFLLLQALLFADTTRPVLFKWHAVPFAQDYEVQIGGKKGITFKEVYPLNQTYFEKTLSPGAYFFRVRARDLDKREGNWAESKVFIVPSDHPTPYEPPDATVYEMYTKSKDIKLQWKYIPEADAYSVVVRKELKKSTNSKIVYSGVLSDTEVILKNLSAGIYTWSVASIYNKKYLAEFDIDMPKWQGKRTKLFSFAIEPKKLKAPVGLIPIGKVKKNEVKEPLEFAWRPVNGAEAYEVKIEDEDGNQVEAVVPTTAVLLPSVDDGSYNFSVRALASKDSTNPNQVKSPESEAAIEYGTRFLKEERGNLKFSFFQNNATYQYPATRTLKSQTLKDSSPIVRLSGEFWFNTPLGLTWGIEEQFAKTSSFEGGTESLELGIKYLLLGKPGRNERRDWLLSARVGVQNAKFLEYISSSETTSFLNLWGPNAGLELRKYFWENFSLGATAQYFHPIGFFGESNGRTFKTNQNLMNLKASLDFGWAFAYHWEANLGLRAEARSIKYSPGAGYSTPGEIGVTSYAGFLSFAYSFGR